MADIYSPDDVTVTFGGNIITGFAKGSFVKVTRSEDAVKPYVGADAREALVYSKDRSGEVSLTLMPEAQANAFLDAAARADEATPGSGVAALQVKVKRNGTTYSCEGAAVKKMADAEFSTDQPTREWMLVCPRLDRQILVS